MPLSGAFFMVAMVPYPYRKLAMFLPFVHCFELMRGGYFGHLVKTYYDIPYAMAWSAGWTLLGLLLFQFVRERIEVQ
jgi:capsular polysaccharide transport system permease protein